MKKVDMKSIAFIIVSLLLFSSCTKSVKSYNVDFDGNGNDSGATLQQRMTQEEGKSIIIPGKGTLSRKGFQFNGWNTKADLSGTRYEEGSSAVFEYDVTLYAAWSPLPESKPVEKTKPNLFRTASESNKVFFLYSMKDGKILATNDVPPLDYLKRYERNGDLDASFNNALPYDGQISGVLMQPDGKLVVWGIFRKVGSSSYKGGIVGLNANGTIDDSFSYDGRENDDFVQVKIQTSGKMIARGTFYDEAGHRLYDIRRLNSDGSIDTAFHDASEEIKALGLTPKTWDLEVLDDKIYYAAFPQGDFADARYSIHIIRLNEDGTLDDSFKGLFFKDVSFRDMIIQPDGKIVIQGMIILDKPPGPVPSGSTLHGKTWYSRYDPDGSEDPTYHPFDTETKTFTSYVVAPQATINVYETKYRTIVLPIWTKNGVIVRTFSLSNEVQFLATMTIESENSVLLSYYEDEDIRPESILRIARVKL